MHLIVVGVQNTDVDDDNTLKVIDNSFAQDTITAVLGFCFGVPATTRVSDLYLLSPIVVNILLIESTFRNY